MLIGDDKETKHDHSSTGKTKMTQYDDLEMKSSHSSILFDVVNKQEDDSLQFRQSNQSNDDLTGDCIAEEHTVSTTQLLHEESQQSLGSAGNDHVAALPTVDIKTGRSHSSGMHQPIQFRSNSERQISAAHLGPLGNFGQARISNFETMRQPRHIVNPLNGQSVGTSRSSGLLGSRKFQGSPLLSGDESTFDRDGMSSTSYSRPVTAKDIPKLSSFVPKELLSILQEDKPLSTITKTCHALVMLADISGFTSLSENLCSRGAEGVDELSEIISDFLGALIEIVKAYNGDIVAFAGDALIIIWPTDEVHRVRQTLRVFQCGLALAELTRPQLTLHIGIASGKTHFMLLGGTDNFWNWLVIGEAIVRMGDAEGHASSREVVVTKETFEPVKDVCEGEEIEEKRVNSPNLIGSFERKRGLVKLIATNSVDVSTPRAESDPDSVFVMGAYHRKRLDKSRSEAVSSGSTASHNFASNFVNRLRCFVPNPAAEVLRAGGRYINEYRKRICVLFMMIDGFPLDIYSPDSNGEALCAMFNEILVDLQHVLFSYNGLLRQFLVDDKGCVFIACFGVAGYTHRDDPLRALSCGLNMAKATEARQLKTYIGLSTGAAFCGAVGSTERREYAMVGRDVNLAARLMSLSRKRATQEGETSMLICCDETFKETRQEQHIDFLPLEPVRLKGYENEMQTYQCLTAKDGENVQRENSVSNDAEFAELVGRSNEMKLVFEAVRSTKKSEPTICFISGEQGMGKSHMISQLKQVFDRDGDVTLYNRVFPSSQSAPYGIFQQLFWQLLHRSPHAKKEHESESTLLKDDLEATRRELFRNLMTRVGSYFATDDLPDATSHGSRSSLAADTDQSSTNKTSSFTLRRKITSHTGAQDLILTSSNRSFGEKTPAAPETKPTARGPRHRFLRSTTSLFMRKPSQQDMVEKSPPSPTEGKQQKQWQSGHGFAKNHDIDLLRRMSAPNVENFDGSGKSSSFSFHNLLSKDPSSIDGEGYNESVSKEVSILQNSFKNRSQRRLSALSSNPPSKFSSLKWKNAKRTSDRIASPFLSQVLNVNWTLDQDRSFQGNTTAKKSALVRKQPSLDLLPHSAVVMNSIRKILKILFLDFAEREQQIVILLDDMHFIDSLTGKALHELIQAVEGKVAIIFTRSNSARVPDWCDGLLGGDSISEVQLSALGRGDCLKLIKTAAEGKALKKHAIEFILSQSLGNPGQCAELAKSLADSEDTDLVECTTISAVIERAVQARFDLLPDTHRALLKTAAVIGPCFPIGCLRDMIPRCISRKGDHMLNEVIEDLVDSEWLEVTNGPNNERVYAFRTNVSREVCYNLNTTRNLKILHLSAAQYYQKTFDDDLRPYFVLLSHHYSKAHHDAMALKFMMYSFRMDLTIDALPEAYAIIEEVAQLNLGRDKILPALAEMKELVGQQSLLQLSGNTLDRPRSHSGTTLVGPPSAQFQQAPGTPGRKSSGLIPETRYGYSAMMSKIEVVRKDVLLHRTIEPSISSRNSSSLNDSSVPDAAQVNSMVINSASKAKIEEHPTPPSNIISYMCTIV